MKGRSKGRPPLPRQRTCEEVDADRLARERHRWATRPERDRELAEIARHLQPKPALRSRTTTDLARLCTSADGQRLLDILKSNDRATVPSCSDCDDTRQKLIEDGGRRYVVPCMSCSPSSSSSSRPYAENVPFDYRTARLSNYTATPQNRLAREAGQQWLASLSAPAPDDSIVREVGPRRDMMFVGGTGTGKTRLCATLLNEAYAQGHRTALFVQAPSLIQLQLEGIDDPARKAEANAWLDRCRSAEPLAIDDVAGAEAGTDYSRRVLLVLYEHRVAAGLHTLWTTNLSLDQLAAFFGDDRLPSRWAERAHVIEIAGGDWRVQPRRNGQPPALVMPMKDARVS